MRRYLILSILLLTVYSIPVMAATDNAITVPSLQLNTESYLTFNDTPQLEESIPPLKPGKVLIEIVGGIGGGILGGAGGAFLGQQLIGYNSSNGWDDLIGVLFGSIIGYTIGGPLGVYMVGSSGDETGSLFATMGGGILGTIAFSALANSIYLGNDDLNIPLMLLASPIGATIGFNATRRYTATASSSLVNIKDRVISYHFPSLKAVYKQESKSFVSYANLLQVSF